MIETFILHREIFKFNSTFTEQDCVESWIPMQH